jgi:large subunit ribosomal protein L29
MKAAEIVELSSAEILERIEANQDSLTRMKLNHAISQLENPQSIVNVRRDIARMKTILRQREINVKQS